MKRFIEYLLFSLGFELASVIKKSIYRLVALELAVAGGSYLGFRHLRRNEKSREYIYKNYPSISKLYYFAEDSISFGQLTGTRLRMHDLRSYVYEGYQKQKPEPTIPIQSWDKYVQYQKAAGKEMSGQAGPFSRVASVSAPLKGSFPLDHEQKCKLEMLKYMCCLHEQKQQNTECRDKAREYFHCRMENGLMDRDEWEKLGYGDVAKKG